MVNHYEDGSVTRRRGKLLNEIDGKRIPGPLRYQELLQQPVGLVSFQLGSGAGGARLAVVLDKFLEAGPGVVVADLVEGL